MILHRLTLRAIGPYSGEHSIDFAALGASGVFLLEGPTGSGKSTIIDAVVFALYGGLAGSTSSPDRLRSHHAAATVEPFVEVVFETAAGIHRIRRTPSYRRPKTRGTGTTPQNQTVSLVLLTSPDAVDGTVVSTSAQEVGAEIGRVLGLTKQQFVQTVVLPQGEFAAFLRSTGEKRKEVLQSLFGTEIYEKTTAQLVERRVAAHRSIAAAEREVELATSRLREATGVDDDVFAEAQAAGGAVDLNGAADLDAAAGLDGRGGLDDLVAGLVADAADLAARLDAARADRDAARLLLDEQRRLQAALGRRETLTARDTAVREAEAEVRTGRARLDDARRASSVFAAIDGSRRADERRATTAEQVRVALATDGAPELDPVAAEAARDTAAARRDSLTGELGALTDVARLEEGLPARVAALEVGDERLDTATDRVLELDRALDARPEARVGLVAALTALSESAAVAPAEAALADATRRRERLDDLARREDALESATEELHAATRVALEAAALESDLRRRKITGMAGELAATLGDDDPCPVCGSTVHPHLAATTADHPDDELVDRASDDRARRETDLAAAASRRSVALDRRDERAAELDGVTPETVGAELEIARAHLAAAHEAVTARAHAEEALERHDAETDRLRAAVATERLALATARERAESDRRRLDDDAATVAQHLAGRAETVASLVADVTRRLGDARRLVDAFDADAAAADAVATRRADLDAALSAAGLTTVDEVALATLEPAEMARLDALVAAHDRERAVVAAGLAEPEIAALTGDETPDVEHAESRVAAAEATHAEIAAAAARAGERASRSTAALAALTAASAVGDAASRDARAVVRMADLASASSAVNVKGVTLGTYVLLRRFDDVVAAANARLSVMSSGRYELQSSDERESGSRSRKTGLALAIRDHATDSTRDPGSFSGGETFYASLSLALGLADVVQAEAGGLELGTLFVDEGFGSLDPATLDAVMTELGRLSASGRVVGIVSHVDELKQRIADRIEVRRLPDGSSTLRSTVLA